MLLFGIMLTAMYIYASGEWEPDKETRIKAFYITTFIFIVLIVQFYLIPNVEFGVGLKP